MNSWLGKPVADKLYMDIGARSAKLRDSFRSPGLGLLLVGQDPASEVYVRMKGQACEKYGLVSKTLKLSATATHDEVAAKILELNRDPEVDGFIVQLPLPKHLDERALLDLISPDKDVDCLTADNIGRLVLGEARFLPCTPAGILDLLEYYDAPVSGKHVVVIGRSQIVGRPMSVLLSQKGRDATVTVAHSRTHGLDALISQADGIIAAIGVAQFVHAAKCKPGAWIVDVGVNRVSANNDKGYALVGDVLSTGEEELLGLTPVPGGVGPLTIANLLKNCVVACERTAAAR